MRILVFGITGMLGHVVWLKFKENHETFGTIRKDLGDLNGKCPLFADTDDHIIDEIDVLSEGALDRALEKSKPEVAINCVGIIKQLRAAKDPVSSISINALFPHILARECVDRGIRLIHISTDCVFSGKKGGYGESSISEADDLYGRTKFLGEVTNNGCLTIRTSMIGRELSGRSGLLEWFLSQNSRVRGYCKAIFSGLTTYALADIIRSLVEEHTAVDGLYHVSAAPISKYELLNKVKEALGLDIKIIPDESVVVDRSLDSTRFRELTHIHIPTWGEMIEDLAKKVPDYATWRY